MARTITGFIHLSRCSGMPCCEKGETNCVFCCICQPSIHFCSHIFFQSREELVSGCSSHCVRGWLHSGPVSSPSQGQIETRKTTTIHIVPHIQGRHVWKGWVLSWILNVCNQQCWFRRLLKVRGTLCSKKNSIYTAFLKGSRSIFNLI